MNDFFSDFPILPFGDDTPCGKCGSAGRVDRYSKLTHLRGPSGELLDTFPLEPVPEHLVIRCVQCGWEWLTETKTAA